MERASVQFEVDDDSDSGSSSIGIKEEPISEDGESYSDGNSLDGDIEVKQEMEGGNAGMAAVMAKILKKSVEGSVIMSKSVSEKVLAARKRRHIDNAEPGDVEVVKTEAGVKQEQSRKKVRKTKPHTASLQQKLEKEELGHTLPDPLDRNSELTLIKIATRGVVQLFNAVKQQQGKIKEKVSEVKSSIGKTDKVISTFTSGDFLDRLKSQNIKSVGKKKDGVEEEDVKQEVKEEPTWSALRDDYMMGAQSMKDWDKEDDVQESNDSSLSDSDSE